MTVSSTACITIPASALCRIIVLGLSRRVRMGVDTEALDVGCSKNVNIVLSDSRKRAICSIWMASCCCVNGECWERKWRCVGECGARRVVRVRVAGCALDSGVEAEDRSSSRSLDLLDLDMREPSRPVSLCSVRMTKRIPRSACAMLYIDHARDNNCHIAVFEWAT